MSYSKTWSAVVSTVSSLTQQKAEITTSLLLAWTSVCAVCVSSAVKYQSGHQNYAFITSHSSAVNTSLWNPETGKTFSRRAKNEQSFCESWQLLHLRLQTEEMFFKFKFNGNYEAIPNFSPLDTAWWITHWLTWHSECKASFQLVFQKLSSLLTVFGFWSPSPFISSVNHIPVTGMDFGVNPILCWILSPASSISTLLLPSPTYTLEIQTQCQSSQQQLIPHYQSSNLCAVPDLVLVWTSVAGPSSAVLVTWHVVYIQWASFCSKHAVCTHLRVGKIREKRWFILIFSKWQRLVSSQYNGTVHQAHLSTTKYCSKHEQHASLAYYICIMQIEKHIQDKLKKKKAACEKGFGQDYSCFNLRTAKDFKLTVVQQTENRQWKSVLWQRCSTPTHSQHILLEDAKSTVFHLYTGSYSLLRRYWKHMYTAGKPSLLDWGSVSEVYFCLHFYPMQIRKSVYQSWISAVKTLCMQPDAWDHSYFQSHKQTCQIQRNKYSQCEYDVNHKMLALVYCLQKRCQTSKKEKILCGPSHSLMPDSCLQRSGFIPLHHFSLSPR